MPKAALHFGVTLVLALALCLAVPADAQSQRDLEAQRQAAFAQLLRNPVDRVLMADYVRLSIALRDYESAAATLERFVLLEPENIGARLDLAEAYFTIGANELANAQVQNVIARSDDEAVLARARAIAALAAERGSPSRFSGRVTLGASADASGEDAGVVGSIVLSWRQDMGGRHAHDWVTDLGASGFTGTEADGNERRFLRLRTGPEFRIAGTTYGPRLQPYIDLSVTRDAEDTDINELSAGLALQVPHGPRWTSFADISYGRLEDLLTTEEFDLTTLSFGATFRPSLETRLRFSASVRNEDGPVTDRVTQGARIDLQQRFGAPVDLPGTSRDWVASGFALFDRTSIRGPRLPRTEDRLGYGLSLTAYVTDRTFVELGVSRVDRRADIPGFDSEETVASFQFGWEF